MLTACGFDELSRRVLRLLLLEVEDRELGTSGPCERGAELVAQTTRGASHQADLTGAQWDAKILLSASISYARS